MSRPRAIAVVAALLLFSVAAVWLVGRSGYLVRVTGGPLGCPGCGGGASSISAVIDEPVSYGLIHLRNRGRKPAIIETVKVLDGDRGIDVIGTVAVNPPGPVGLVHGYPPAASGGQIEPVEGYVVDPTGPSARGVQVVLGVRLRKYGRYVVRYVVIEYHVGRAKFRAVVDARLALCASPTIKYPDCETPL